METSGVAAKQLDASAPSASAPVHVRSFDDEAEADEEDDEEKPEPVKMLDIVATFENVVVWGHEVLPAPDDAYVKGIEEWIAFAETV